MNRFLRILEKNFKLIWRQKSSLAIILLGPLMLVLLLGFSFNNSGSYTINVGFVINNSNDYSNAIVEQLSENFEVIKLKSIEKCEERLKQSEVHICMHFPNGLSKEPSQEKNEIVFFVDNSRVNLVYRILDTISTRLSEASTDISMDLTNVLLYQIDKTQDEINKDIPILERVIKNNTNMTASLLQIYEDFKKLDLIMYPEEFEIENLERKQELMMERDIDLISNVRSKTRKSIETLDEIDESIDGSEINASQKQSIRDSILNTRTWLAELSSKASETSTNNDYNYEQIKGLIKRINLLLNETYEKLKTASSVRQYSVIDIDNIINDLKGSYKDMNYVKDSLADVNSSLRQVKVKNATNIVNPIITIVKPIVRSETQFDYIFPTLIAVVVMLTSILLASIITNVENRSMANFRNSITTATRLHFIFGNYTTNLIVILFQLVLLVLFAKLVFGLEFVFGISVLIMLLLLSTIFIFIGIFIGNIFSSENSCVLAGISLSSVFLFLSNTILPLEIIPQSLRNIIYLNPFVLSESLLKKLMVHNLSALDIYADIYLVLIFIMVMLMLVFLSKPKSNT